ncbi:alpha/beta hydrolase family protein [Bacillus dakarensis]|uniref:alpha/beta hydrolase family protein n=1 Tax=Robertmurraya dakarensis TaxID=1926278 RepID=UPI00098255DA|nr:alpha/beta fold hydrolase [Bacillus dakarensis]
MATQVTIPWKNKELTGTIHYPNEQSSSLAEYPLIIICHGFVGSRIGVDRLFVKAAMELTKDPSIVLRFDYSGCGESEGVYGQTGLDDFIDQTRSVIDFGEKLSKVDKNQIYLLGHSLGGATAVLTAVRDQRVRNLVIWSAVAKPFRDIINIVGVHNIPSIKKSIPVDYLGYSFEKKYFESLSMFSPLTELHAFSGDVLILHGSGDDEIPVEYSELYYQAFLQRTAGSSERKIIANANHTFSSTAHFNELISATRNWLSSHRKELAFH